MHDLRADEEERILAVHGQLIARQNCWRSRGTILRE
jgi:hypothetical protein